MPEDLDIKWWHNAANESPIAIAFVDSEDKFLYVNREWSILTGYAPSQLIGIKTWQEITIQEDIGGDYVSIKAIKEGVSEEYYMEKKYRRADGSIVSVGVYVHRHPPYGPQEGYLIFAKPLGSKEIMALQNSFEALRNNVTVLEHISRGFERIDERVKSQYNKIDSLENTVNSIVSSKNSSINIGGDVTGKDKTGRDKNSWIIIALSVISIILFAGVVLDRYISVSKERVEINKTETRDIE